MSYTPDDRPGTVDNLPGKPTITREVTYTFRPYPAVVMRDPAAVAYTVTRVVIILSDSYNSGWTWRCYDGGVRCYARQSDILPYYDYVLRLETGR